MVFDIFLERNPLCGVINLVRTHERGGDEQKLAPCVQRGGAEHIQARIQNKKVSFGIYFIAFLYVRYFCSTVLSLAKSAIAVL